MYNGNFYDNTNTAQGTRLKQQHDFVGILFVLFFVAARQSLVNF